MKLNRLALLAVVASALATAGPLTITFAGNGSGSVGASTFSSADFTFTFTSDTAALITPPPCCPDTTTPSGTTATYLIAGLGSGSFTGDQAVFVNPGELTAGIWHYNDGDWLTIGNLAFGTFNLATNLGPISGITSSLGSTFPTTGGTLALTAVNSLSFTEVVSTTTPGSGGGGEAIGVPEPSTLALLGLGIGCIAAGRLRRKAQ